MPVVWDVWKRHINPDVRADLADYVVDKGIQGIFLYLAREEAAIRADPAKRTTELIRKLFSK